MGSLNLVRTLLEMVKCWKKFCVEILPKESMGAPSSHLGCRNLERGLLLPLKNKKQSSKSNILHKMYNFHLKPMRHIKKQEKTPNTIKRENNQQNQSQI